MARIRTVKPSFFRHEGLQELEIQYPGTYPMFVFAGLWGHCDKLGRFRWRPKTLKLDILPFLPFDMVTTLCLLEEHGYLIQYEVDGEQYGFIPTFTEHQRISGKEAQEPSEYPDPIEPLNIKRKNAGKQSGSNGEAPETAGREGKGREGKGKEQEGKGDIVASLTLEEVVNEWNQLQGVVRAQSVTGPIRERVNARIREHQNIDWWRTLFKRVEASDFLAGRKSDFAATLDWVLGPKNLAKILNGNYDNRIPLVAKEFMKPKSLVDLL